MGWVVTFLIASLFFPLSALAQDASPISMEIEDIADDYATCAAYYRLVYHGVLASNRQDIAAGYRQLEDEAMFYSLLLANEGRDRDMAVQVTNARVELNIKNMLSEINNRNENIAILMHKYGDRCIALSEEPPAIAQGILARRLQEASAEKKQ